ncbi:hypothetical protein BV22DRAFT_151598 [Leucogyrophana mollusca]|uniref:Uncharacterized protein n=1 Tax=Leucogyrophana mollusca TaxID=85980 RepID=A0ACB8BUU7_9AGAM|nr:hypothetical protein BV22DRAFT_151598 [Leucogyrophana mollusca]
MDPDRHLRNPGRNPPAQSRRLATPSVPEDQSRSLAPSTSQYPQQSLPSIRQLHPYLPPSGMSQSHLPPPESSGYTYPPPSVYSMPSGSGAGDVHAAQTAQAPSSMYARHEVPESEPEGEAEQQGPAKKKRRRQALSCNECKRRKIKCDRAQPCGPCTRRGEQTKCQWRTLEPVDKYVSRAEYEELKARSRADYEELKARFDHLETVVSRLFAAPAGSVPMPMYSMPSDLPGPPPSESVPPYHTTHPSAGSIMYPPSLSPSSFQETHPKSHRYSPTSSPHVQAPGMGTLHAGPSSSGGQPPQASGFSHMRRPSDAKSPTTVRQSPLSLASITSPYYPDSQSKNYLAQTFMTLGERLRPAIKGWKDPVASLNGALRRQLARVCQTSLWKAHRILQCRSTHPAYRLDVTAIRH